ncbi:MAG: hypothetical protein LBL05_06485 [Synergistaceae bacterium]|nr:hypothetical protein [Synergistaceae bacterium]
MNNRIKKTLSLLTIMAVAAFSTAAAGGTLTQPAVDREASERAFFSAYDHFLQNRLWNALDSLSEAISENVYFVDVYYMRSLAQRRLGLYADAVDSMSRYMEVRRDDYRAGIILDVMKSEQNMIKNLLAPESEPSALIFSSHTVNSLMSLPVHDPLSLSGAAGLGKISSSENNIFVCDTLGGKVWIFDRGGARRPAHVALERPAAVMPVSPELAFIFLEDGSVYKMTVDSSLGTALEEEPSLDADVADAVCVDSTFFAAADREGGYLRFAELPAMRETLTWRPPDEESGGKLFEPVAVAAYGPLLAAADRSGGKVYVLDAYTLNLLDSFDVERPRDLEWGPLGELYVLSERGTLFSRHPIGGVSADIRTVADGMSEAWSMTWAEDSLLSASVSARTWWKGQTQPGRGETFGAVRLHDPWIDSSEGTDNLLLRGTVSSPFQNFIQDKVPTTQVIWRGEVRPSRITSVGASFDDKARFYAPAGGELSNGERIIPAGSVSDIMDDIAGLSRAGEKIPRVIVADSRISAPDGQIESFLAFLLQQGVRLDVWAVAKPASIIMNRVSKMTSGKTYYTETINWIPRNGSVEWVLSVPLPPDITTYGYPSDTTLSLFSDIDMIRFSDWVPIWPSLIDRGAAD